MLMRFVFAMLCLAAALCRAGTGDLSGLVFQDLNGVTRHPLEPTNKAASILIFYWHDCPVCNSYAPEINRICSSYTNFAFYIVQIDPDLNAIEARRHAQEYALQAPVLLDPRHRLVKVAKATVTPEAVIFGKAGEVLYRGRIDGLSAALGQRGGVS